MTDFTLGEHLTLWGLSAFVALWVFALGANLGSFLNVVVYRMPRGMPLALSVSRCPKCANPIAIRDNIPIVSWLLLRGRCRSCGQTISARYPLVESAVGGLFLLLFFAELLSGGRNLPLRPPGPAGFMGLLVNAHWDLVGIFAAHSCLLYLLLAVAQIQADRRLVPWKLVAIGIFCGLAAAPFQLLTVDGQLSATFMASPERPKPEIYPMHWPSLAAAAAGIACGAAWGTLHALVGQPESTRRRDAAGRAWPVAVGLAGLFLGWQAVTSIAVATCLFRAVGWLLGLVWPLMRRVSATGYALAAGGAHLVTWHWNDQLPFWPGHDASPVVLGCICLGGAAAALIPLRPLAFPARGPLHALVRRALARRAPARRAPARRRPRKLR